jgi:hypothetical protein
VAPKNNNLWVFSQVPLSSPTALLPFNPDFRFRLGDCLPFFAFALRIAAASALGTKPTSGAASNRVAI